MPLHVRVTTKKSKTERQMFLAANDLSQTEPEERFLEPYARGDSLVVRGSPVRPNEIERIEVFETAQPSAELKPIIQADHARSGLVDLKWGLDWWVGEKGRDRTHEFIKGPPGFAANSRATRVETRRTPTASARDTRTVFVVHGRDQENTDALFGFLRALRLDPREFSTLLVESGEGSPYVGEIVRGGIDEAGAVVVLVTADDTAVLSKHLRREGREQDARAIPQPRANVIFEAGLAMASERPRTIVVQIGDVPPYSDLTGRHTVRFDGKVETRKAVAERLRGLGCSVDTSGDQWLRAGTFNFESPEQRAERAKP